MSLEAAELILVRRGIHAVLAAEVVEHMDRPIKVTPRDNRR